MDAATTTAMRAIGATGYNDRPDDELEDDDDDDAYLVDPLLLLLPALLMLPRSEPVALRTWRESIARSSNDVLTTMSC